MNLANIQVDKLRPSYYRTPVRTPLPRSAAMAVMAEEDGDYEDYADERTIGGAGDDMRRGQRCEVIMPVFRQGLGQS
jgi:hypothetical protein